MRQGQVQQSLPGLGVWSRFPLWQLPEYLTLTDAEVRLKFVFKRLLLHMTDSPVTDVEHLWSLENCVNSKMSFWFSYWFSVQQWGEVINTCFPKLNGLYYMADCVYGAFLVLAAFTTQVSIPPFTHIHTLVPCKLIRSKNHSHTEGRAIGSNFRVQYLAHGCYAVGSWNRTSDFPVGGRPLYRRSHPADTAGACGSYLAPLFREHYRTSVWMLTSLRL